MAAIELTEGQREALRRLWIANRPGSLLPHRASAATTRSGSSRVTAAAYLPTHAEHMAVWH